MSALISQLFCFHLHRFVNSFASFYYMAFILRFTSTGCDETYGDDETQACLFELKINLIIILGERLVIGQITEVGTNSNPPAASYSTTRSHLLKHRS